MSKTKQTDEPVAQQPIETVIETCIPGIVQAVTIKPEPTEKEQLESELFQLTKQELLAKNLLQQIKDKKKEAEQNYLQFLAKEQINTNKKPAEFQLAFDEFQILCE